MAKPGTTGTGRIGWILRIAMAVAIIAAAMWSLLPEMTDRITDSQDPSITMVTIDDVNLRAGPGTSFDILAIIPAGTEVASAIQPESGFLRVRTQGQQGWISADYLSAPGRVVAQSQTVSAAEPQLEEVSSDLQPVADDRPEDISTEALPEPTAAPTYQAVEAYTHQVQPDPQPGEKWIEVNRSTRTVTLHNGEIVVAQFTALVGKDPSPDGYYSTATGTFYVHVKEKSLVETPFAEGVYLTDFVGFDPQRSNGFHSPVRDEYGNVVNTGGTSTLGCVRLAEDDAIFLFDFAHIGMRVEVHD